MNAGGLRVQRVRVRDSFAKKRTEADFEAMLRAERVVFIFPLYIFCLPGMLMRYLQTSTPTAPAAQGARAARRSTPS
jgi:FMN-dependent NADH-azoreductase